MKQPEECFVVQNQPCVVGTRRMFNQPGEKIPECPAGEVRFDLLVKKRLEVAQNYKDRPGTPTEGTHVKITEMWEGHMSGKGLPHTLA